MSNIGNIKRVASIQMSCDANNIPYNLIKAEDLIKEAKSLGAEVAVLPELFNIGYDLNNFKPSEYNSEFTKDRLSEIARKNEIMLVGGIANNERGKLYNSTLVFNKKGFLMNTYNKMNLFPLSQEHDVFTEGNEITILNTGEFKIGFMICFDIRFAELSNMYREKGCNVLFVSSAFPFPRLEHWQVLLKARAIENQVYIVASNRCGTDNGTMFVGNSCIIDPWGTVKALMNESDDGVIVHDICTDKITEVRNKMDITKNKTGMKRKIQLDIINMLVQ